MPGAITELSDKQRETLRLIGRGHDAKSCARTLDLSVHTINERLRDARRTLGVSSSREAARMLVAYEADTHQNLGDTEIGGAAGPVASNDQTVRNAGHGDRRRDRRTRFAAIGVLAMSLVVAAMLALSSVGVDDPAAAARNGDAEAPARDGELEAVARAWLEQAERGDWRGSYDGTAESFRSANTLAGWQAAASGLQERLGKVVSREAISFDSVPTPPNGSEIVRFRTVYEKGGTKVETVALAREGSAWKIVGCYVE